MFMVVVEFADSPDEAYGPFPSESEAVRFAEDHELGGYSVIEQ